MINFNKKASAGSLPTNIDVSVTSGCQNGRAKGSFFKIQLFRKSCHDGIRF